MSIIIASRINDILDRETKDTGQVDINNFVNSWIMAELFRYEETTRLLFPGLFWEEISSQIVKELIEILKDNPDFEYIKNKSLIRKKLIEKL